MAKPIKLNSHTVHIKAPRELIFQMMASFGRGRLEGDNNESSRIVSKEGNNLVVEFKTRAGLFSYTTVEEISLDPPARITFRHLSGPLYYAYEEFLFEPAGDFETNLTHTGEFIWKRIPFFGWFGGMIYTKPTFEKTLEKHMAHIKESSEARAARSRVFRRPSTDADEISSETDSCAGRSL